MNMTKKRTILNSDDLVHAIGELVDDYEMAVENYQIDRAAEIVRRATRARKGSNSFPTGHPKHEDIYADTLFRGFVEFFDINGVFNVDHFRELCKCKPTKTKK
jgi:hypothetical protein